jgi:ClpP class serine protease
LGGLQGELHDQFVAWVSERRGERLSTDHDDLFSGEVWTGAGAVKRGLVDGLGTLRGVLAERYPDADIAIAEPRRALLARLGIGGGAAAGILGSAIQAIENRATWSRFGL